jgi:ankyrin repeat protein
MEVQRGWISGKGDGAPKDAAGAKRGRPEGEAGNVDEEPPAAKRSKSDEVEQSQTSSLYLEALPIMVARGYLSGKSLLRAANACKAARWDFRVWERIVKIPHGAKNVTSVMMAAGSGNAERTQWLCELKADVTAQDSIGRTAIHLAAQRGHPEAIKALVRFNANVNVATEKNWTPLHYGINHSHAAVVLTLLQLGADADVVVPGASRHSPLTYAAAEKSRESVCLGLVNHGANVQLADSTGWTALHYSCKNNYQELFARLIERGLSINAPTADGQTPLFIAAYHGTEGISTKLLDMGAETNMLVSLPSEDRVNFTLLHAACKGGLKTIVARLLELGLNIHATAGDGSTPLHIAAMHGHAEVVSLLLSKGALKDAKDNEEYAPLALAAWHGSAETARRLLQAGADMNAKNEFEQSVLHFAALGRIQGMVQLLLDHRAQGDAIDCEGDTPLIAATKQGNLDAIEALIRAKVKLDVQNNDGCTALTIAIVNDRDDVVKALLAAGASITLAGPGACSIIELASKAEDATELTAVLEAQAIDQLQIICENGQWAVLDALLSRGCFSEMALRRRPTIMHKTCASGYPGVVLPLLKHGFDPNARNESGETPLHSLASSGYIVAIPPLLQFGADIEAVDKDGKTALHTAVEHDSESVALHLLRAGASPDKESKDGKSPLIVALERGRGHLASLLLRHSADFQSARTFLHSHPTAWPQEGRDAFILHLVDSLQLLPPNRKACSPQVQGVVDGALQRFAQLLSSPAEEQASIPPYRRLTRWLIRASCSDAPEVALPNLPAIAAPPAEKKPNKYRASRIKGMYEDAWERRGRLVSFFAKAQKAKAVSSNDKKAGMDEVDNSRDGSHGAGGNK